MMTCLLYQTSRGLAVPPWSRRRRPHPTPYVHTLIYTHEVCVTIAVRRSSAGGGEIWRQDLQISRATACSHSSCLTAAIPYPFHNIHRKRGGWSEPCRQAVVGNYMATCSFMHPPAARRHSCDGSWSRATAILPEKNQRAESMLPFLFRCGRAVIYKITPSPSHLFARRARWC